MHIRFNGVEFRKSVYRRVYHFSPRCNLTPHCVEGIEKAAILVRTGCISPASAINLGPVTLTGFRQW
jgi:hypothetical protein